MPLLVAVPSSAYHYIQILTLLGYSLGDQTGV